MSAILLKNIDVKGVKSDILIEDGVISSVLPAGNEQVADPSAEILDCTGRAALPGFVNMHTHSAMTLTRGYVSNARNRRRYRLSRLA